jgi:hypothetical protein
MFDRSDHEGIVDAVGVTKVGINGKAKVLQGTLYLDPCQGSIARNLLGVPDYWQKARSRDKNYHQYKNSKKHTIFHQFSPLFACDNYRTGDGKSLKSTEKIYQGKISLSGDENRFHSLIHIIPIRNQHDSYLYGKTVS